MTKVAEKRYNKSVDEIFLYLQFGFVIFWQKNIDAKAASEIADRSVKIYWNLASNVPIGTCLFVWEYLIV